MVSFGSSLRMARRSGWEGAYLDYESLKLLLSQIEAVYEEEGHRQRQERNEIGEIIGAGCENDPTMNEGKPKPRQRAKDYRDELFLESDSDAAFDSHEHSISISSSSSDDNTNGDQIHRHHLNRMYGEATIDANQGNGTSTGSAGGVVGGVSASTPTTYSRITPGRGNFSLSYSHEPISSSEEDENHNDYCQDIVPASKWCSPLTWKSDSPSMGHPKGKTKSKKLKHHHHHHHHHYHHFQQDAFFVSGEVGSDSDEFPRTMHNDGTRANLNNVDSQNNSTSVITSLLNAPFHRTKDFGSNENTSLLTSHTKNRMASSLYSFPQSRDTFSPQEQPSTIETYNAAMHQDFVKAPHQFVSPVPATLKPTKWEIERKLERKRRRKRKLRLANKRRRERDKKVPRHIRVAHSKARAITERFLGLLRAETEKVMLFAQARLGELAETVGSLRFPTIDDTEYGTGSLSEGNVPSYGGYGEFSHTGGLHSSSSSSDEETGGRWRAMFPWSSDTSEASRPSERAASLHRSFSEGGKSVLTQHRANLTSTNKATSPVPHHHHSDTKKRSLFGSYRHHDGLDSAQRQIQHFEELRRRRSIFQRNDQIVGEDLLLISAVDEADGYTAVGVELMHVLRYICVNLIAVRKICRKHDRLLMNRMLGGYYHHTRTRNKGNGTTIGRCQENVHTEDAQILGALLASASGDIFEAHPYRHGYMNHDRLVGLYDVRIQQLANSRTVQVISSCLALALSEYEASRSRADALARLNSSNSVASQRNHEKIFTTSRHNDRRPLHPSKIGEREHHEQAEVLSNDEESMGPSSTASGISLARLRFTVTSIVAIREAARAKQHMFSTYLSRSQIAFTGKAVVGDGLDGCSRETLDFLVSYNPDAALLLGSAALHDGLKHGLWSRLSIGAVMSLSLTVALTPVLTSSDSSRESCYHQEQATLNALSIFPTPKDMYVPGVRKQATRLTRAVLDDEVFRPTMYRLSRISCLLYTMNYYCVHPMARTFVAAVDNEVGRSAAVIGAPCLSAIIVAMLQCYVLARDAVDSTNRTRYSIQCFRWLFVFSCCAALFGNGVLALAVVKESLGLAILGRFLIGFGSAEILHRQMISYCLPVSQVVMESARLMQFHVVGLVCGLLLGSFLNAFPIMFKLKPLGDDGFRYLQCTSWIMFFLWFVQLVQMLLLFKDAMIQKPKLENTMFDSVVAGRGLSLDSGSDSSTFDGLKPCKPALDTPRVIYRHSPEKNTSGSRNHNGEIKFAYGRTEDVREDVRHLLGTQNNGIGMAESIASTSRVIRKRRMKNKGGYRYVKIFVLRLRKLLSYNVALPVSLAIVLYVNFAQEALISSCPIIVGRYFDWNGSVAGLFLAGLTMMTFPINFVCERISRKYEERTVVKRSIVILLVGLFLMVNLGSFLSLAIHANDLWSKTSSNNLRKHFYDWVFGTFQYVCGLSITFIGLIALEGSTLCLVSKLAPSRIKGAVDVGTIVVILTLFARLLGDIQILMVELSHRLINTDIVNALTIPLLIGSFFSGYFVRKHFFFLM